MRSPPQHDAVGMLSNDERLRKALVECLREAGASTALVRAVLPEILHLCEDSYGVVRDPVTGLTLPAGNPALRYSDRPRHMTMGEYAEQQWPEHLSSELLFLEDIYKVAHDYYKACRFQADRAGVKVHDFVRSFGILSRPVMTDDPVRYQRQLNLLKALDHMNQANTRVRNAQDLIAASKGVSLCDEECQRR